MSATVREVIEQLERFDPYLPVRVGVPGQPSCEVSDVGRSERGGLLGPIIFAAEPDAKGPAR